MDEGLSVEEEDVADDGNLDEDDTTKSDDIDPVSRSAATATANTSTTALTNE